MTILMILFAVSLLTQAKQHSAIPVEFSDFSTKAITINFDSLPDGTSIPGIGVPPYSGVITNPDSIIDDEYASLGVTFTSVETGAVAVDDYRTEIPGISPPNSLIGTSDSTHFNTGGPIFVCFVDPLSSLPGTTTQVGTFSLDVDIAPVSFIAYDSQGNEVGRTYFSKGGNGSIDFAGLRYDEGIARIAINVPRSDYLAIDNFIFEPVAPVIMPITIDIKPQSCPNPLNLKSKGVLPVAVLSTEDFDVIRIDPATVGLGREGVEDGDGSPIIVSPLRWAYEDVATPFEGELCDCHTLGPDRYLDLTLKFSTPELVEKLELDEVAGETIPLTLTGSLEEEFSGTPVRGEDCISVQKEKGPQKP